jgi:presenilin-like A22 family membrane protease
METRGRLLAAAGGTALLFLLVQLGALALVGPFVDAGYQAVDDPADPANSVLYLGAILVMTGFILVVIRVGVESLLRVTVIAMSALLAWYVFSVAIPVLAGPGVSPAVPAALAALVGLALFVHPEWYVIDLAGVVIGAGGAGLFGISFGPLPAILLLGALAVYDALAVYRTEHMLTLAESVTGLKLPLVLVVPLAADYSFRADEAVADREGDPPAEREAFFIGLGDTVMPTILVASAVVFLDAPTFRVSGLALNLPALAALVGTHLGLAVLLWQVSKGRPHAGLPLLNGGAIAGYLLGALAVGIPLVEALGLAPYL